MAPSRSGLDKTAHNSHTRQTTATSAVHTAYASGSICWKPGWRARAGVRTGIGCQCAQRQGQRQRARTRHPQPPARYRRHCYPQVELARGRARGTRPGARLCCVAPFFTEQGRAHHIALAGSPVTRNADSTTPLCAHLQCRVLHLALPQMKRCCLDGRLLRRLPHRGCFVCFGSEVKVLRMRTNE